MVNRMVLSCQLTLISNEQFLVLGNIHFTTVQLTMSLSWITYIFHHSSFDSLLFIHISIKAVVKAPCIVLLLIQVNDSTLHGSLRGGTHRCRVNISIAASVLALFARSPAEPTLEGSDKMSAIKTCFQWGWSAGAAWQSGCQHGMHGETYAYRHHGTYDRLDTLACISRGRPFRTCLGEALESNQHLQNPGHQQSIGWFLPSFHD